MQRSLVFLLLATSSFVVAEFCAEKFGSAEAEATKDKKDVKGWVIGIVLCIGSAFCSVVGVTFQKKAHMRNEKFEPEQRKSYVKIPLWWLGIFGVILGAVLDFLSLGYAPQTVVASLGSMTLVINAFIAPCALGEKLSRLELAGTFTITFGAALAVASSSQKSQEYNLEILKCLYREDGFIIFAVLISLWVLALVGLFKYADKLEEREDPRYYPFWAKIHPVSITALSGTLGAQSLLFAKSVSIILRGVYAPTKGGDGGAAFAKFETYLILFAMIFTIVTQTHTLNMALQRFDSVIVLPLFQVFWIITGVFGAGAYFKEFDELSTTSYALFPLGILIIALGIGVLTSRAPVSQLEAAVSTLTLPSKKSTVSTASSTTPVTELKPIPASLPKKLLQVTQDSLIAGRRASGMVLGFSGGLVSASLLNDDQRDIKNVVNRHKSHRQEIRRHSISRSSRVVEMEMPKVAQVVDEAI